MKLMKMKNWWKWKIEMHSKVNWINSKWTKENPIYTKQHTHNYYKYRNKTMLKKNENENKKKTYYKKIKII